MINEIIENGFDGQHFIIGFGKHLRSLLVCKDPATNNLLEVSANLKERYQEQSSVCPANFLLKALDINNNYDINYKSSNNKRLHLEIALMQICMITSNLSTAEKKTSDIVAPKKSDKQQAEDRSPAVTKKVDPPKTSIKPLEPETKRELSGSLPGTISILQVTETNNGNDDKNKVQEGKIESYPSGSISDFSQNQLEEAWARFIKVHTNNMPSFTSALNKYKPEKKNETVIKFQIDNKIVAGDKEKSKILLGFLKKELQNISITLEPVVIENDKNKVAYTDKEKYDKMVKNNPSLQKFKDQLGLEIDF